MSADFCLNAVAASLQLGRRFAGIKALSATELATRDDSDAALVTMEGADPTAAAHFTTKSYVDGLVNGNQWKNPARVCSGGSNVTLSGPGAVIDGVTLSTGDRVLLLDQTVTTENGLWVFNGAASAMTRPTDYASGSTQPAAAVFIEEGTCSDDAYVSTADPNVVDTNSPAFVLFGTISPGVTSVNDAVAVPAGGSSFLSSAGSGAVTMNVLDDSARISVSLAASVITLDIVAASIDTAQLTNQGVTAAKLDVNASLIRATFTVTFSDQGTTVTGPTLLANSRVVKSEVDVTAGFDDTATTIDVQVAAVSFQGTAESDASAVDIYQCNGGVENAAAAVVTAVVGGSANTVGAARISVYYYVTA